MSSRTFHRGMRKYRRWYGLLGFPKGSDIKPHGTPHPIQRVVFPKHVGPLTCATCGDHVTYGMDGRYYHVTVPPLPFVTTTMSEVP